jgi:tetratricopeptide (TPR) repeat protein
MARKILITSLIVILNILTSCGGYNRGQSQLTSAVAVSTPIITGKASSEVDLVEQVVSNRQAYRQSLEMLIQHYNATGNNMKMQWAKKELNGLETMPKYKYIVEGEKSDNLKASTQIQEADTIYQEAVELQRKAEPLVLGKIVKDEKLLRVVLDKYDQLINKYPSSDKIDDAAFKAGEIYEYFKDYTIALLYYKRAYQWDPATPYPARYRAAYILDKYMRSRSEALVLYQQALEKETTMSYEQRLFTENRIKELQKTGETPK